ncbi:MAG: hypothetical protein CMM47_06245 [Rhodospirillaceae bacterium]|nr:hypothetical protein [Rhodospirillaceae bacterium]
MLLVPLFRQDLIRWLPHGLAIAEIGVAEGEFSAKILDTCVPERLYLIDAWEHQSVGHLAADPNNPNADEQRARYEGVLARFDKQISDDRVSIMRAFSHVAAREFADGSLDVIYVDGDHSYDGVSRDLETFAPKLRNGGLIFGHDYTQLEVMGFGVIEAVNDFVLRTGFKFLALTTFDPFPTFVIAAQQIGLASQFTRAIIENVRGVVELARYPVGYSYSPKYIQRPSGTLGIVQSFRLGD